MAYIPYIHEFGVPNGRPVLVFHGFPGSHLQGAMFESHAQKFNARILAPDRPGYGYSDPLPGKGLRDFMQGLERGLKEKNIDKFYVAGVSGGNPSAICAAGFFAERVLGVASICGMAPYPEAREHFYKYARTGFDLARRTPEIFMRPMINQFIKGAKPEEKIDLMIRHLSKPDQDALNGEGIRKFFVESIELARRQGPLGIVFDLKSLSAEWPVDWSAIRAPLTIWHGQQDRVLSHEMAVFMHRKLPHSTLKLLPGEGHYSLPIKRSGEILEALVGRG
jgi:pimeloyl-ACP methyl ester carboxylesterase